jgi:hypothetical protein
MGRKSSTKKRKKHAYSTLNNTKILKENRVFFDHILGRRHNAFCAEHGLNTYQALAEVNARMAAEYGILVNTANNDFMQQFIRYIGLYHNIFITDPAIHDFLYHNPIKKEDNTALHAVVRDDLHNGTESRKWFPNPVYPERGVYAAAVHFKAHTDSLFFVLSSHPWDLKEERLRDDAFMLTTAVADGEGGEDINYTPIDESFFDKTVEADDKYHMRAVYNLFLYLEAFPHMLKQGIPKDVGFDANRKGKMSLTVHPDQRITEDYQRYLTTPHLRRGHMRYLSNERFTTKRFQTVYVRPSMIRSKSESHIERE